MENPWLYKRCREVQNEPDGCIDMWAREHGKSSIITFGKTVQDILASHGDDPLPEYNGREWTFGIFSHTRPIAKDFLKQIKREFEENPKLKTLFPDVLYDNPQRQSPKWALDVNTPVLTVSGWKRHGDLEPGDQIFGSRGQAIRVTGNSGPMEGVDCLRVTFDDCEMIASADHLWPVECVTNVRRWADSTVRILKTSELTIGNKNRRHLPTPALRPESSPNLPVDPYVLGLWLGDGTIRTNIISAHREDEQLLLAEMERAGYRAYIHRRKPDDNFSMWAFEGLKEELDGIGVSGNKHVPQEYLLASYEHRLSLLQGLMDSDGTCKKMTKHRCGGMCMFSNTNPALARAAFHLAASLGLRPSIAHYTRSCEQEQDYFHVRFVGVKAVPPFRNERKLANCKEKRHQTGRYLRGLQVIPSVTVNCIKVDAEDSLYLAGECLVPTHNSEDEGLIVKRKSNPREATVEAWGLVDGQPTGKHFYCLIYDDVVTDKSVTTPDMINKTTQAWSLSTNLGARGGVTRIIGTRYHYNDTYSWITEQGAAKLRSYPATDNGKLDGAPVLLSREQLEVKYKEQGSYIFNCQMLLDPKQQNTDGFHEDWLRHTGHNDGHRLNIYLLCDPANEKSKRSDYTVMEVIGIGADGNRYLLDGIRDRLNLTERANCLINLHREWQPIKVGYEKYGKDADISHIKTVQDRENYRFDIVPLGGRESKPDRIRRLIPLFQEGRFYLPNYLRKTNYEGRGYDFVQEFITEYKAFPFMGAGHDDILDCCARIEDPEFMAVAPKPHSRGRNNPTQADGSYNPLRC